MRRRAPGSARVAPPALQAKKWSTGGIDGHETDVVWKTATLHGSSDTVGTKMVADPLGPEHAQGGPPKSGQQPDLMGKLETDPGLPAEDKYIRGHLLNDNLGGPGVDYNLFPITAKANSQHLHSMEKYVKGWVNDDKHWVKYQVDVAVDDVELRNPFNNYVDAKFRCQASILDPDDDFNPVSTRTADIVSEHNEIKDVENEDYQVAGAIPRPTISAFLHSPLLSSSKAAFAGLDEDFQTTLIYCFAEDPDATRKELAKIRGVGNTTIAMLEILAEEENFDQPSESQRRAITKIHSNEINVLAALAAVAFKIQDEI